MCFVSRRDGPLRRARGALALAVVAVAVFGAPVARAADVVVTGRVDCASCAGAVGLDVRQATPAGAESPLFVVALAGPGPFAFAVPETLGFLALYAFPDDDADGQPATAGDLAAYGDNPIPLADGDVADVVLTISAPATVRLAGVVRCPTCAGPLVVGVWPPEGDAGQPPLVALPLAAPGPFAMTLAPAPSIVRLGAFEDLDGDGLPTLAADVAFATSGPLRLDAGDRDDLVVDLAPAARAYVLVTGAVTCADCAGGLRVVAWGPGGLDAGAPVAQTPLDGPGLFVLGLPRSLGVAHLAAFRDADGDGTADGPGTLAEAAANPIALDGGDVTGVTIALPPESPTYGVLAGTVACADCAGPVGLRVLDDASGAPATGDALLGGPGPFAVAVPRGPGAVGLYAYRDSDADGVPDEGSDLALCDQNPLAGADAYLGGLTVTIPARAAGIWTDVSGVVRCDDCARDAVVDVWVGAERDRGIRYATLATPAPGPFGVSIPSAWERAWFYAGRDDDGDGSPDADSDVAAAPQNPVSLAGTPVTGVAIDLPGSAPAPLLSGEIVCATCPAGAVVWVQAGAAPDAGNRLREVRLGSPGRFVTTLPETGGTAWVFAARDDDDDGAADPDATPVGWDGNPFALDGADVAGVVIDLDPPPPPADESPSDAGPAPDTSADVIEPDVSEPDVSEPDVIEPDVIEPDVIEPDVIEPDVIEPDASEPDQVGPPDTVPDGGLDAVSDIPGGDVPGEDGATADAPPTADVPAPDGAPADGVAAPDVARPDGARPDTGPRRDLAHTDGPGAPDAAAPVDAGEGGGGGGGGGCDASRAGTAAPLGSLFLMLVLAIGWRRRAVADLPRRSR